MADPVELPEGSKFGLDGAIGEKVGQTVAEHCREAKEKVIHALSLQDEATSADLEVVGRLRLELLKLLLDQSDLGKPSSDGRAVDGVEGPSVRPKTKIRTISSDDDNDIEASSVMNRRKLKGEKVEQTQASGINEDLLQIISKIDNRIVPKPDIYNVSSGQPLEDYLKIFEEYCENTFKGSQRLWVSELGRFLEGQIQHVFDAIRSPGDSYMAVKEKLLSWVADSREDMNEQIRRNFAKAKVEPGEPLRLYAVRLEKLHRVAYPHRKPSKTEPLIQKFIETVPVDFQKQLRSVKTTMSMMGNKLTWKNILSLASSFDIDRNYSGTGDDSVVVMMAPEATLQKDETVVVTNNGYAGGNNQREQRQCHYCKKKGHLKAQCRLKLGLCLACGSGGHMVDNCSRRKKNHLSAGDGRCSRDQPCSHVSVENTDPAVLPNHSAADGPLNFKALRGDGMPLRS